MIVQCPQCSTRFRLDPRRLGDRGAKVTCSVCSYSFVVTAGEREELDPFASMPVETDDTLDTDGGETTEADARAPERLGFSPHEAKTAVYQVPGGMRMRSPAELESSTTALDLPGRNEPFGSPSFDVQTAPHAAPREDTRPDQLSAASVLGEDFLPRYPDEESTQADDVAVIADDDVSTIEEGEFETVDDVEIDMDERAPAPAPQRMQNESSRTPTVVAAVPSLTHEQPREESKIHRLPIESQQNTVVQPTPSLERPVNTAHEQVLKKVEIGAQTFVGKIDPSLLRAARHQTGEHEPILMSGGLSADGTYTPPQEPTRPAIVGYGGLSDDQPKTENRRVTRPMEAVGLDERAPRQTGSSPLEVSATTRLIRGAVTAVMMVGLTALGLFALVRSGQLDIEVLKDPELIVRNAGVTGSSGIDGVTPVALRSLVYPTSRGASVLVFTGEVKNGGPAMVENLDVVAELRDASGSLVASAREPLGAVLTVAELAALDDQGSIDRAFAAKRATGAIAAGARVPYMVVIAPVPRQLRTGRHLVRLVQRPVEAPVVSAPALTPAPTQGPTQAPAPIVDEAQDDGAQRKAKMKGKRMKMKRKASGEGDAGSGDSTNE